MRYIFLCLENFKGIITTSSSLLSNIFGSSHYEDISMNTIIAVYAIFIVLTILLGALFFNIRMRKEKEKQLELSLKQLSKAYEELNSMNKVLKISYKELEESQKKTHTLAYYDPLTNLPNKNSFIEVINELINNDFHQKFTLICMDIDNFRNVNDTLGHEYGDEVIKCITNRILFYIKKDHTLFRFSGDEFHLLVPIDITEKYSIKNYARGLLECIESPIVIDNKKVYCTSSIGIAVYPYDGEDRYSLLKNAETAMYSSKMDGKNKFKFYNKSMGIDLINHIKLENALREAIYQHEFELYYQPKVNVKSKKTESFEALIRWNSSSLGYVSPMDFIPIAEETGLIVDLGKWILREACEQKREWNEKGYKFGPVAVNISAVQMQNSNFFNIVKNTLLETGIKPQDLELEITESILIKYLNDNASILNKLVGLGIGISLDDFGTKYSSLNYLKNFPISVLKIDKSYIDNICSDESDKSIVETIINLSHKLKLKVVAEGVEVEKQYEILKKLGCDFIQGYYFSKPLPPTEIYEILNV